MRIAKITLGWFRGAAEPVTLELVGKSVAVYGQNGAGKSSFVDGLEFVISGGKINHLSHEYSGRNQEKAILNTHAPAGEKSTISIEFGDGSDVEVDIARNGAHTKKGADKAKIGEWDYKRTVLRQDEVAAFISARKGEKYSALLPLLGLHELEVAAENIRQLPRAIEQQSEIKKKQGSLDQVMMRRKQTLGASTDKEISARIETLYGKYCPGGAATEPSDRCSELEEALKSRIDSLSGENQKHLVLKTIAGVDVLSSTGSMREANAKLAEFSDPLVAEKLSVLQSTEPFLEKVGDDREVACPACGRTIQVEQLKGHLAAEQERLKAISDVFNERKSSISALIDSLKTVKTSLGRAEIKEWRDTAVKGALGAAIKWVESCNPERFRGGVAEDDIKRVEANVAVVVAEAKSSSNDAPPAIRELADEKVQIEVAGAVFSAAKVSDYISDVQELLAFVNALEASIREEIRERSEAVIKEISDDIEKMWKILHPDQAIDDVHLYLPEDDKAIDIALKFYGKEQNSPRLTLSEGYRNSLGLCIFLALAKREAGTDRPVFLDDVVVSMDRNHRGMIVELIEKEFSDRQVVILTHDRDWYADLRQQLDHARWKFGTLLPYETPDLGIRWAHKTSTFGDARAQLRDRPDAAGNDARKIMDVELGVLAEKLQLRVPYLRGDKNDKRSWSDFLDGLISDGKRCFQRQVDKEFPCDEPALASLDQAKRLLVSWGNRASHSNDVVRVEAGKLIDACEAALASFTCRSCSKPLWFSEAKAQEWMQCQCGQLRWRYGKG